MLLDALLVVVLTLHLLAVNLAGAGPLVCLWLDARQSRRGDEIAGRLGADLARRSRDALLLGGLLGLALLGLLWIAYPRGYFDAFRAVQTSRLWFLIPEYFFSLAILALYAHWWPRSLKWSSGRRWGFRLLNLVGTTNLLYHFPTQFAVIGMLTHDPALADEPYRHVALMARPEALAAIAHHLLAAVAVAGIWLMGQSLRLARAGESADTVAHYAAAGARWALVPTLLQVLVGLAYLLQLPERLRAEMLGDDLLATPLFGAAVLASLWLMHTLAGAAWGDVTRPQIVRAMFALTLVVLLMSAARHAARQPYFEQAESRPERVTQRQASHVCAVAQYH